MPEIITRVRWPDGVVQRVYSPSLVITEHLDAGHAYPVEDFVPLVRTALTEASARVQAKYGFPCSNAMAALAAVEARARVAGPGAATVEAFEAPA